MIIYRFSFLAALFLCGGCGSSGYVNDGDYETDVGRLSDREGPELQAELTAVLDAKFSQHPVLVHRELLNSGFVRYSTEDDCVSYSRYDAAKALIPNPLSYDRWIGVDVCPKGVNTNVAYRGL